MNKYTICALLAAFAITAPASAIQAQEAATPPSIATEASEGTSGLDGGLAPAPAPAAEAPVAAATEASEPAPADGAKDAADDPLGTLGEIRSAVQDGNWGLAVLLALMLLVALLRWGAGKIGFLSFFKGKLGGYLLVFTSSTGGMLLTVIGGGGSLSFSTISQAVIFGFGAIGGWEAWKDVKSKKPKAEAA